MDMDIILYVQWGILQGRLLSNKQRIESWMDVRLCYWSTHFTFLRWIVHHKFESFPHWKSDIKCLWPRWQQLLIRHSGQHLLPSVKTETISYSRPSGRRVSQSFRWGRWICGRCIGLRLTLWCWGWAGPNSPWDCHFQTWLGLRNVQTLTHKIK